MADLNTMIQMAKSKDYQEHLSQAEQRRASGMFT